jgi:hypothetical protein
MKASSYWCLTAVAATLAVAGCGAAGSDVVGTGTRGQASTGTVTSDHKLPQPLSPERVARQLLNAARVPAGAVRTATPTSSAVTGDERRQGTHPIELHRWWRINEPWRTVYSWVANHQAAGLTVESSSSSAGPALTDVEHDVEFSPPTVPLSVNSATLELSVAPLSGHSSAISAYAVVVRQPPRPAAENVPLSVNTVTVTARRNDGGNGKGPILSQRTITGAAAQTLVRDFDALTVRPQEVTTCPLSMTSESATFRANGHVWTATTGTCIGAYVSLDGHSLATLDESDPFDHDLQTALGPLAREPLVRNTPIR